MHIVVIPGTNREGSLSHRLAALVAEDYTALGHEVDLLDLREMGGEFLESAAYARPGPKIGKMIDRFLVADGVVFIVPEYNGSYPGVLKLFLDMLPDPAGFAERPICLIGLAAGRFQSLRAVEHLQSVASYRNAYVYPRRIFIGDSYKQFHPERRELLDEELRTRLTEQASGFCAFAGRIKG